MTRDVPPTGVDQLPGRSLPADDERAVERLIHAYCHLIDGGAAARVCELFTEDATWGRGRAAMVGGPAIAAGFAKRQAADRTSRHVCTNVVVSAVDDDPDAATAICTLTLYRYDGVGDGIAPSTMPDLVGSYRDRFRRTPEGWRFTDRQIDVGFQAPTEPR